MSFRHGEPVHLSTFLKAFKDRISAASEFAFNIRRKVMPRTHEMVDSKYLKQQDVPDDTLVTIVGLKKLNVALEDQDPQMKWCVKFEEFPKPMVLNSTNIQLLERACGSDNTDDWIGKQVTIYVDPNVSFAGKLTGGLRVRLPRKTISPKQANQGGDPAWGDSECPF